MGEELGVVGLVDENMRWHLTIRADSAKKTVLLELPRVDFKAVVGLDEAMQVRGRGMGMTPETEVETVSKCL